jgi:hypothetical protein
MPITHVKNLFMSKAVPRLSMQEMARAHVWAKAALCHFFGEARKVLLACRIVPQEQHGSFDRLGR